MLSRILFCLLLLLPTLSDAVAQSSEAIEDLPSDERGGRFREIATGITWLDVSNFYGRDYLTIQRSLIGTGFRFATKADVQRLIDSVGQTAGEFGEAWPAGIGNIVQQGYYDDTLTGLDGNLVGQALAGYNTFDGTGSFGAADDALALNVAQGGVGAWVVQQTAASCALNPGSLDFDCDGKDEKVVWREGTGTWYIRLSGNSDVLVQQWGLPGDIPIAGDYDGDGVPDLAVWRPTNGTWYIKTSQTQYSFASAIMLQFGLPGDKPLRTDYDGDGRLDVAVWRPGDGNFYVVRSADAQIVVEQWGLSGDVPLTAGFQNR